MPSMLISDLQAGVGAGGNVDVRPPAGEEWYIYAVGNDVAFAGNVPDVQIYIRDGIHNDAIVIYDPSVDASRRYSHFEFNITYTMYLRIQNTGGAGANISWCGEKVRSGLSVTDIRTIGAGATIFIQPPPGETWQISYSAASVWNAVGDRNPNVTISITDGTLFASNIVVQDAQRAQDRIEDWIIDSNIYLCVTDQSGAGLDFGFIGTRVAKTAIGAVQDVAGAGNMDIRPPAGNEWVITEISAEQWGGAGAALQPDIDVSMIVGANLSELLQAGSIAASPLWNNKFVFQIDNSHYLRVTNVNVASNEVGYLGYLKRSYS